MNSERAWWVLQCVQAFAVPLIAVTLVVYYRQLRTMRAQLETSKVGTEGQNLLALISLLESENVRKARHDLYHTMRGRHWNDWTAEEKRAAALVAATYDIAGLLVREKLVPEYLVLANWGPNSELFFGILRDFMNSQKSEGRRVVPVYGSFRWLVERYASLCAIERSEDSN